MEKKGFIMMKLGKPIKFVALKPVEVIERVKRNVAKNALDMSKRLDELKGSDVLEEIGTLFTNGVKYIDPADLSGAIRGRNNIYNHLEMMIRGAEKNVTIVTTADGLNRKFESLKATIEKARKKGVSVRIVAPITPKNFQVAKDFSKIAEVRNGRTKARFMLIDGKEALFMVVNDEEVHPSYDVGVWVNSPFFTGAWDRCSTRAGKRWCLLTK